MRLEAAVKRGHVMVKITRDTHTPEALYDLSWCNKDLVHALRQRGVAMVLEGFQRGPAARAQGVDTQTLPDYVRRYNERRSQGLRTRPKGGSRCRLGEVFQFLEANRFANRLLLRHVAAVRAACKAGWEWLRAMPERIAMILRHEWAAVAEAAH